MIEFVFIHGLILRIGLMIQNSAPNLKSGTLLVVRGLISYYLVKNTLRCTSLKEWRVMSVILIYLFTCIPLCIMGFCIFAWYDNRCVVYFHVQYYELGI